MWKGVLGDKTLRSADMVGQYPIHPKIDRETLHYGYTLPPIQSYPKKARLKKKIGGDEMINEMR